MIPSGARPAAAPAQETPVIILREGTSRERTSARSNNILAAKELAQMLRTTLGPRGSDKMLITSVGDVLVTNDGATILRRMSLEHPAAKMLVEAALTQEREAGDGTKTTVLLAGELLARAEPLCGSIHPTLVIRGYQLAAQKAADALDALARPVEIDDDATLVAIARTSMSSKLVASHAPLFATMAMRAVRAVARPAVGAHPDPAHLDLARVRFVKRPGGDLHDSELIEGVLLERERGSPGMPARVPDARVLLLDDALTVHKPERSASIRIQDAGSMKAFAAEEERMIQASVARVLAAGANVLLYAGEIAPEAMHLLERAGVLAIERVTSDHMQAVSRATGARSTRTADALADDLGRAALVEERRIGTANVLAFTGCPDARSVSILLRGGSEQVLEEAQRTLEDALGVLRDMLRDGRALPGAGAPEIAIAKALRRYAASVGGREQLAIDAFADAMEIIPRTLAENAGHDAIDTLVRLRSAHEAGRRSAGVSLAGIEPIDAWASGVIEPIAVARQAIESAAEVACMILRVDEAIVSKRAK